jgi:hypothetical protein
LRAIKINVTREHIRKGIRGSPCDCPIALAIKEALITQAVSIGSWQWMINHVRFLAEDKDVRFMQRFDEGKPVRPYSFFLDR